MKCVGCNTEMIKQNKEAICEKCYLDEVKVLADLTVKYGEKRAQLLFMGYPSSILELDDNLIDYTHQVMMTNLKNELG